jgi:hypothetical protein
MSALWSDNFTIAGPSSFLKNSKLDLMPARPNANWAIAAEDIPSASMWEAITTLPQCLSASPALCADDHRSDGTDDIRSVLPTFSPQETNCLQYERHEHQKTDEHDGLDCSCQKKYEYGEHNHGDNQ